MLNHEYCTEIVEDRKVLPFQLQILVGGVERAEVVPLRKVTQSISQIMHCIYDIQELKPLRLVIHTSCDAKVTFVWNKVNDGKKQGMDLRYHVSAKQKMVLLYEHGKTEYIYPWRCGLYHFEIIYDEEVYLGAIRIVPKNFNDEQLTLIQNTVQSLCRTLLLDRGYYKKTFRIFTDLEDSSYMNSIRLLLKKIPQIKQQIIYLEKINSYIPIYEYNHTFRKPTSKTIRKNERRCPTSTQKQWNRKFRLKPSDAHQYVKYKLVSFLARLQTMILFIEESIVKLEHEVNVGINENRAIKTIMQSIEKNGSVTDREKHKYKNLYLVKDMEMKKASVTLQEFKILHSLVIEFFSYMLDRLHQPFWNNMKIVQSYSSLPFPFRQCIQLLELNDLYESERMPSYLFVYKPTYVIYEYYVYVSLLFLLQEIGFVALTPVLKQIQSYFYIDGLQDGTTVELYKNEKMVKVVYNELIETHPLIALEKNSNFYNGEDTKKPDIRVDYYERQGARWQYRSSIIIEVKYSPMYNIFQPVGNTKATEQMYKYWSIKYVEEKEGKRFYQRRAIYEVVCVYPGSQVHPKKVESGCGVFIQFYPYKTKNDEIHVKGKAEMMELFSEWLDKF
ncbi:hypothetical protein [Ectobacillus polymachus]|uniref:hypothetical protein n=1 Tax=Ectobacillus polymachus TaxID=1508806 RepID=UPI003A891106